VRLVHNQCATPELSFEWGPPNRLKPSHVHSGLGNAWLAMRKDSFILRGAPAGKEWFLGPGPFLD
jgi:hypothetical protein